MSVWTPEIQTILAETAQEVVSWARAEGAAADEALLGELEASGMQVNIADREAFVEASQPVYERFAAEVENGQDMIDQIMSLADGT